MSTLFLALFISLGIQIVLFIIAYSIKTDKLTDISYSLTFAIISIIIYIKSSRSILHLLLLFMILIWSLRLGIYLLIRINKIGKDKRFDNIRDRFFKFLGFWIVQGFTVWFVLINSILYFDSSPRVNGLIVFGIIIWILGLLIEGIADHQKFVFKNNLRNKNNFIQSGLWRYSRHPNYFGEFLMWLGIYLLTIDALDLTNKLISLISPFYLLIILIFVSGIPILERSYEKRYGREWKDYKDRTSMFIILPHEE